MTGCIVGWSHLPFGKHDAETVESLVARAARGALEHAGVAGDDIDDIYLGHFNAGFSEQDFTAALVLQADDGLRFKRATRCENACATGSARRSLRRRPPWKAWSSTPGWPPSGWTLRFRRRQSAGAVSIPPCRCWTR